jgi:hypothetical protein
VLAPERVPLVLRHDLDRVSHRTQRRARGVVEQLAFGGELSRASVFELIDEGFGGSAAWLSGHGLSDAELESLRRRIP